VLAVAPAPVVLASAPAALAAPRSAAVRACTTWVHTPSPNAGTGDNNLHGITAVSARDAWAVGEAFVGVNTETLVEHWNGKSWKVASSPNEDTGDELKAVYAVSATNVWAAGSYYNGTAGRTLIDLLLDRRDVPRGPFVILPTVLRARDSTGPARPRG